MSLCHRLCPLLSPALRLGGTGSEFPHFHCKQMFLTQTALRGCCIPGTAPPGKAALQRDTDPGRGGDTEGIPRVPLGTEDGSCPQSPGMELAELCGAPGAGPAPPNHSSALL